MNTSCESEEIFSNRNADNNITLPTNQQDTKDGPFHDGWEGQLPGDQLEQELDGWS